MSDGRRSRRRSTALERVTDGVVSLDRRFRFRYVNPRAEAVLDRTEEDLLGRTVWEAFAETIGTVAAAELKTAMATGEPRSFERHNPVVDRWLEVRVYPDEDGLTAYFTDVTARVEGERERRTLTEEYEAVLDNADDAVFLVDVESVGGEPTFRFARLNPAHEAATGLNTAEIRGRTPREVLGAEVGAEVAANYRRCVEAGEPIAYEEELDLPGGRRVWQTNLAPVVVNGEVTRIVGVGRDVTDRVERERELARRNERLDEFARVVSHDLRNPLTVARGCAALLLGECDEESHAHLDPLVAAIDRMAAIVDDTLTLARQGETVGETRPVAVADLADRCWSGVETADAVLDVVDEFTVQGDGSRLRHVFENLFRNAVEHGGEGVTVRVGRAGDAGFYVADDGPGIPAAARDAVFEPGDSSATDGTGFGLAIVARIAEAHGWQVVATAGRDGGARFEFRGVERLDR
jgi:PAS domain S-box-containing protein